MSSIRCLVTVCLIVVLLATAARPCAAQGEVDCTIGGDICWVAETGTYNEGDNWTSGFVPDVFEGESAAINNGGTAIVDDSPLEPLNLYLGRTAFNGVGSLEIHDGGKLLVGDGQGAGGQVQVGGSQFNAANGFGNLTVLRGGELEAETLTSNGDRNSSIVLGQAGGSGTAKATIFGTSTLSRNLRIVGSDVEFTTGFLNLTPEHVLTAEITGPTHATISVTDDAILNGSALHVDFSGYTPTLDDTWDVLDAFLIDGQFGQLTASGLPPGAGVFVSYPDGGQGSLAQLSVGTQLALTINRRTGQTAIENRAASASVEMEGYVITGIDDANSSDAATLAPESSIDLAAIYTFTPTAIGEQGPPVGFEYDVAGGETIPGRVEFNGPYNNLVLVVDPETGDAAIQNQSTFDVDLDGYLISSLSGSLDAAAWSSLQDGGRADWAEANPSSVHLAELNLNSSLALAAGSAPLSIGSPFDVDAEGIAQDLAFEFHLAGGDTVAGVVEYGSLGVGLPLDCNGDGVVDAADLDCACAAGITNNLISELGLLPGDLDGDGEVAFPDFLVMSANFGQAVDGYTAGDIDCDGTVAFADFLVLSANFGQAAAGAAGAASVPEPALCSWAGITLLGLFWRRSTRRSRSSCSAQAIMARGPERITTAGACVPPWSRLGTIAILLAAVLFRPGAAQTLTPAKQIFVSDSSDRDMVNGDMDPGPLDDDGDIVARERRDTTQDNIQIRTFLEFDVSSISAEQAANPAFGARLLIDFVTRLNTVNDMTVVIGRVLGRPDSGNADGFLGDTWTTEPGSLPLFEWGRSMGESTAPDLEDDRIVVVENVKTDALGTREADVTDIVVNWVTGVHDNNGFSVAGGHDEFQGAGLNNARLIVGIPGDFDGSGTIDFADFLLLSDNFAAHLDGPVSIGDMDFDGDVDLDDFGQFKNVFAAAQGQAQAQAVPEPPTVLYALWAVCGLLVLRGRRHGNRNH